MRVNLHGTNACGVACCTKIEHVSVSAGMEMILDDVSLHMHCGETTALIGPNGAGKSTLMRAILGELPHSGDIRFTNAHTTVPIRPVIGYVPQTPRFDPQYPATVCDLFLACTSRYPVWLPCGKKRREWVREGLRMVDVDYTIDRRVGVLSGGELQRVLLALALNPQPQLLLLDEPSSGVDVHGLSMFYETVERVKENADLSVLLISHDPDLVRKYADRVVLINRRVVKSGTPDEVLTSAEYKALLG